jgi:uncharacterized protein YdeI (YjbR/CyaY-like superfamily)
MPDLDTIERQVRDALKATPDAAGLFNWLTASHREAFLEWVQAGGMQERTLRIETIVAYLSDASPLH